MKAQLIRIRDSRGIRIPKAIIEQCGFGDSVELRVENSKLIVAAKRKPREGWTEAFASASTGDDELLLPDVRNDFDREEWR